MLNYLLPLIGIREYWVRIVWDDEQSENEVVYVWAWSASRAIQKITKKKDVTNKADMIMLEPLSVKGRKYRQGSCEPLGKAEIAKSKDDNLEG